MKNSQKGFLIPLITAIVAVLAVGVGVYYYSKNKVQPPIEQPIQNNQLDANLPNDQYNHWFSKDIHFVYFQDTKTSFDPATFEVISDGSLKDCGVGIFVKDKYGIYVYDHNLFERLPNIVDTSTFKPIIGNISSDKDHVFSGNEVMPNTDPKTYKPTCNVG